MSFLEVKALSLSLGGSLILDDLSFSLERGRLLVVVGPNGAGKSSLLRCVGQIYKNYSGCVSLEGVPLAETPRKKLARRIAWVHQEGTASLSSTVREFAEMSRYPWQKAFSGISSYDRERVEDSLTLAGVGDLAERELRSLSGGERQRALIASALAQETDVLFLDEPMSFLDYRHQVETLELIQRINKERGMTIILITHDINLALRGADKILALKKGRLVWCGNRDGLLQEGLLDKVFDTDFVRFADGDGATYVAPRGLAR